MTVFVAPVTVVKNLRSKKNKNSESIRIHKIIGLPKPSEQTTQKINPDSKEIAKRRTFEQPTVKKQQQTRTKQPVRKKTRFH